MFYVIQQDWLNTENASPDYDWQALRFACTMGTPRLTLSGPGDLALLRA